MSAQTSAADAPQQVNISDIVIKDENTALNLLVQFLNLAQKRGAFNMEESAKIWECVKMFQRTSPPTPSVNETIPENQVLE